jgi:hypothetical protein
MESCYAINLCDIIMSSDRLYFNTKKPKYFGMGKQPYPRLCFDT